MSNEIKQLEPKRLWEIFYELTQIPRPSKKERQAVEFARHFGEGCGLETVVDDAGNVIIRKPATEGMEDRQTVVLQGHLDMVPQKNSNIRHDFEKDPLDPYVEGEWVKARDTTLGSDNGIGVAAALSILDSGSIIHGPLEVLLTVDEETGMTGAFELEEGVLKGSILLNMDSEDEGELYIGCAGGVNTTGILHFRRVNTPGGCLAYKLEVNGLKGGHSGLDIHMGRGNSNILLNRFLWNAGREYGLRISGIEGGSLRNAIPRESTAWVVVPEKHRQDFLDAVDAYEKTLKNELGTVEPGLKFRAEKADKPGSVMDTDSQERLLNAVYGIPNGVARMSNDFPGVVETSGNLAIVKTTGDHTEVLCLLRSSVDSAKTDLAGKVQSVMELAGFTVTHNGAYPGWKPDPGSSILQVMKEVYRCRFGKTPAIKVIHAGLECGIIGDKHPGLDMISFGPTIRYPHSPDEMVNIKTVQKFWDFLLETLKSVP